MEDKPKFSANTNIADALGQGPDIAAVFLRYRMYCIGCTFARFETLRAAAVNHQVDVKEFVQSLNEVVSERKLGSQLSDPAINQFTEEA